MAKQGISSVEKRLNEANSSKNFYKLLNNIASEKWSQDSQKEF